MTDKKRAAPESSPNTSNLDYIRTTAAPAVSAHASDAYTISWGRVTSAKGYTRRNRLRTRENIQSKLSRAEAADAYEADRLLARCPL